jgi:hypothetical protein
MHGLKSGMGTPVLIHSMPRCSKQGHRSTQLNAKKQQTGVFGINNFLGAAA